LHASEVESVAFASALSAAMWVLVGLCALGMILTWWFVRAGDAAAIAPEHEAQRHFHLPWVAR
jgi:hypothetical protein